MKTPLRILLVIMIGFTFIMTTGCAPKTKLRASGFLTDYSRLGKDPEGWVERIYIKDNVEHGTYDKIMVDHVTFFLDERADYKGIQPEELTALSEYFHNAIVEALVGAYSFAEEPGPGTLRIRWAITDLVPSKPVTGTITTVIPVGLAASFVTKATTGSHIGMGKVSMEAEFLDTQTGEVLGAGVDTKWGQKYKLAKTFTKWGQVEAIFDGYAKQFRKRLDKLSGRE